MRYSELGDLSKLVARNDYQNGWLETHDDLLSDDELHEMCIDTNNDVNYDESGHVINTLTLAFI